MSRTGMARRRSPRHYGRLMTALAAAGALALAACSGGGDDPADGSPQTGGGGDEVEDLGEMTVVTFLPLDSITFVPEIVAHVGGYFDDHGLDVQLEAVQGSSAALQAVIGGAAAMTRVSTIDLYPALEQDQPIKAIGTMAYSSPIWILSADSNPVESMADLEGEVIGMGSIGGTSENLLNLTLDAAGIDRDTVTRQAVPVTGATFELVKRGELAGYMVSIDTALQIDAQHPEAVATSAGLEQTPDLHAWITTERNLEDEETVAQIRAFLAAVKEAMEFVVGDAANDYANVIELIQSSEFSVPALDVDEVAADTIDWYVQNVWKSPTGEFDLIENDHESMRAAYDLYTEGGLIEGGHDPSDWITDDYLP